MDRIVKTLTWKKDELEILDQTLLPLEEKYITIKTIEEVWEAIRGLNIRGAPAIGIAFKHFWIKNYPHYTIKVF
ncbi:MAG: hypothetical protein M1135_00415 [Candidatus Omnitrophica bacterium]|nr:hypothetical protein [Candidatus Omnitrophota bacterium]